MEAKISSSFGLRAAAFFGTPNEVMRCAAGLGAPNEVTRCDCVFIDGCICGDCILLAGGSCRPFCRAIVGDGLNSRFSIDGDRCVRDRPAGEGTDFDRFDDDDASSRSPLSWSSHPQSSPSPSASLVALQVIIKSENRIQPGTGTGEAGLLFG